MNEQKEQRYDLRIEFPDGSQPANYYCMTLGDIIEVLGKWNKNWIIRPGNYDPNINIWTMYAEGRKENGMSWPEFWEKQWARAYLYKGGTYMSEGVMSYSRPPLKTCPWCGSGATVNISSLGKGNGRGYPGNHRVNIQCTNPKCGAIAPNGRFDDIYMDFQKALDKAVEAWNTRVGG